MTREDRKESMAIIQAALDQAARDKNLLTYEEAAKELHRSHSRIARAASEGILHPISLPGTRIKYIHRDEIEWFKSRTLSEANAVLYRDTKRQQEAEPEKSWAGRIKEFLFTDEEETARLILGTLRFALSTRGEDTLPPEDIRKKLARSVVFNLIEDLRQTEEGRTQFGGLAIMLAEMLTSEKLSPSDRKLLRETLDVLLDMGAGEQDPPSYGRLEVDTEELDTHIASRTQRRSKAG